MSPVPRSAFDWEGQTVLDRDGEKVGKIEEIFLVEESGRPEWALVKLGRLKGHTTLVPLTTARPVVDGVKVDVGKDVVSRAPEVKADDELSEQEAERLYRHYGIAIPSTPASGNGAATAQQPAPAHVLARSGTWVVLHATSLVAAGSRRAAVIVEPAHPARITPLLMSAYGLTEREREVTRRILRGDSTADIAKRLVVSPHTVQEHLKKIFEKTGVRSRRELVGKVFFAHYEPRFRDNEGRALDGAPLRGEPFPEQPEGPG